MFMQNEVYLFQALNCVIMLYASDHINLFIYSSLGAALY